MLSNMDNPDYLRNQQYKDSSHLNARAELHRRFSINSHGWAPWIWDQIQIPDGGRVLELGAGPGWLWYKHRVNPGWHITLSDFSPGMVAEQRANLASSDLNVDFQLIDMQSIPFTDDIFDVIIANHMVYHVPDKSQALAEVRRVLKPGGCFYAATNGRQHLQEIHTIIQAVFPTGHEPRKESMMHHSFTLENGGDLLRQHFDQVDMRPYEDGLRVTEVEPLLAYIHSMQAGANLDAHTINLLREEIQRRMAADGAIAITKASGLFVCR